ncbi:RING finger protein [Ruminococcus sp. Marseille-P6503]|uniref:RING finger protein n=1 Tax=Ruminococcus sp. Marseille-P6503 TaxID=2364796 RepID=UPI0013DE43E9|nr:RING finger protein [Ruminococcus sp. Marseille-P6503]
MGNYIGTKCISCGEVFKEGDDVVVCPECGTPYHRACYEREGQCINTELHEKGGSWQPHYDSDTASANTDNQPVRCARCGETNPPDGLFCKRCGMPLTVNTGEERPFNVPPNYNSQNFTQQGNGNFSNGGFYQGASPFGAGRQMTFDQDSDIDGVKLGDYAKYVGKNPIVMLSNFIRFGKFGGKSSLNLGALLFPQFYFFYRKMPLVGSLFMFLTILTGIPSLLYSFQSGIMGIDVISASIDLSGEAFGTILNVAYLLSMAIRVVPALFANYWYYRTARKDIMSIRAVYSDSGNENSIKEQIAAKGGTSFAALIMSVLIFMTLNILVLFLINKFLT